MNAERAAKTTSPGTWPRVAARLFAASCFFPYPALAIGNNNGLQLSQALALASVPLLCVRPPGRAFRALLLILTPVYLAMLVNVMIGDVTTVAILPKETVALSLAMIVLWPSEWATRPALVRDVLAAAAAAIAVHALVGLYQAYSFSKDEFPLLFLYRNPSFKSMEEWHQVYARYIKRPCALFPEPSAMGASLGPWLVLLAGLLIDPAPARHLGWRGGRAAVLAVAGGFTLVTLSRSGSTFAIIGSVVAFGLVKSRGRLGSSGAGRLAMTALVLVASLGVLGYAASKMSEGFEDRVASSWGFRAISIQAGLTANTDPASIAFGVGPGQSTPIIRRELAGVPLPEDQDELAIFSLAVCYYMETGLVGALALAAVLAMAVRSIARSSAAWLGFCSLGTWLVGVLAVTSYMAMSAIWLFLALMLGWDQVFPRRVPDAASSLGGHA